MSNKRIADIHSFLRDAGYSSIQELSDKYKVSRSTIKRDLEKMEESKLVERVRGGAICKNPDNVPSYAIRASINLDEKKRIAHAAAQLIEDNDVIFIESGSTCFELYKAINAKNITVFTLNIPVLSTYSENVSHLYVLGGEAFPLSRNIGGLLAIESLSSINPTKIFFSTAAISTALDILSEDASERTMAKNIVQMEGQKILLADSSKIGLCKAFRGESLASIDVFITDDKIDPDFAESIRQFGVKVIIT